MAKETGTIIKEKRTAAGMSQAALAREAECVTASEISKVERGMKELTPEQLKAVAEVLGVTIESLQVPDLAAEEILTNDSVKLTAEEQEWLNLYRTADADKRQLALCILKGAREPQDLKTIFNGMFKGIEPSELISAVKNIVLESNVSDLLAFAKSIMGGSNGMGLMSIFTAMSGIGSTGALNGSSTNNTSVKSSGNRGKREPSVPLLAFTFFYSVSIYLLLLSFYFWQWRTDIKPETLLSQENNM